MATLILKIKFPPGSPQQYKLMKFKQTLSIKEVIEEIIKTNLFPHSSDQYVLLLPPPSPELNSLWLEEGKLLSNYPLQPKDLVDLRKRFQVVKVHFRRVNERFLLDINEPLNTMIPLIAKKFQIDNIDDYSLHVRKNELLLNKSIREQLVSTDAIYFLRHKTDPEEEEVDDTSSSEPTNNLEEETEAFDVQMANPLTIKNPQKIGPINVKQGRKKKYEPRWTVLKNSYIIFFKSQNDKKPSSFISIDKFNLRVAEPLDEKEKKSEEYKFTLELYNDTENFFLKCENENAMKSWVSTIKNNLDSLDTSSSGSGQVFGVPLSKVCLGHNIPEIVEQCIKYIEERALKVVGIFRLSGSAVQIEEYKKSYNRGEKVDLSKEVDPHAVAGLLKLYLRELP